MSWEGNDLRSPAHSQTLIRCRQPPAPLPRWGLRPRTGPRLLTRPDSRSTRPRRIGSTSYGGRLAGREPPPERRPTSSPPKVRIKVKKVIESTGAKVGEVQVRSITDTSKVRLGPKERAVYVLRESNGEILAVSMTPPELTTDDAVLKVGRTKSTRVGEGRLQHVQKGGEARGQGSDGRRLSSQDAAWAQIEYYEKVVRSALKSEGHALTWDHTERRGSGSGTPGEGKWNVPILRPARWGRSGSLRETGKRHQGHAATGRQEEDQQGIVSGGRGSRLKPEGPTSDRDRGL